jgi:hypothetical protein
MSATGLGDDLKRYLIVPSSSLEAPSSPAADYTTPIKTESPISIVNSSPAQQGTSSKARKRRMEVETSPLPTMFDTAHDENKRAGDLDGIFDLDVYLKGLTREATKNVIPSKKVKQNNASNAFNPNNTTPLTPVAVGSRSSKHTILLHEKYQALALPQPFFAYAGGSETGWTVSVSFPGLKDVEGEDLEELQGFKMLDGEESKRFNSKQEAKEALSKKALEVLEALEDEGRIKKAEKARKKSVAGQVQQQVKEEKEPGENYVGQLLGMFIVHSSLTTKSDANTMCRVPAFHRLSSAYIHGLSVRQPLRLPPHHRRHRHAVRLPRIAPLIQEESSSGCCWPCRCALQVSR